ncbi:MAG: helix-turn-helix domain-containing protein [Polynucleobacter sp.]|uniref:helix-turn-helix domain-containing protein n=1 Tax=Polynucleobacter sp. TaxID=2029855 RepID=UPI0027279AC1|nr:helix-turn-helix domain-containing protein [Polynucleobacter sp.]MDO8713704.1 helix-turn-helix domain-containing protein [Polynucleobacter sp.]
MQLIQDGLGLRLRAERKRLGYTQVELAKLAGLSIVTYQQYERGEYEPKLNVLNKLGKLGCDIHLILFGAQIEQEPQKTLIASRTAALNAFRAMEDYVARLGRENVSSEERFAMYEVLKSQAATQA